MNALLFILKNWKESIIALLGILVILLYVRGKHETERANQAEQGRDAAIQLSNQQTSKKYKNKQGDTVIVTQVIGIPKSQIDVLLKSNDLKWLKKLEGIKKDGSNLQSAESFSTDLDFSLLPERIIHLPCKDTFKVKSVKLKDKYNNIDILMNDSSKLEIHDKFMGSIELKRIKHWFWKGLIHLGWGNTWEPVSEITNSNKLIKIDSVQVFVIKR